MFRRHLYNAPSVAGRDLNFELALECVPGCSVKVFVKQARGGFFVSISYWMMPMQLETSSREDSGQANRPDMIPSGKT